MSSEEESLRLLDFPEYENIVLIGQGGMSTVYRAVDRSVERTVAIKVLKPRAGTDTGRRFQLEARSLAALKHPNIVEVYKFGMLSSGSPYMVMEYIEGISIQERLKTVGPFTGEEFISVFSKILGAISYAHEVGIVHRDIKPENIMVLNAMSDDGIDIKLLDFGIAKVLSGESGSQKLTQTGYLVGSPKYMSPEQCLGSNVDPRSDLYSTACVMFEVLAQEPLFDAENQVDVMFKHLNENAAERLSDIAYDAIPAELKHILIKALSKSPEERYQSAREMLADLLLVKSEQIKIVDADGRRKSRAKKKKVSAGVLIACAISVILLFVSGLFFVKLKIDRDTNAMLRPKLSVLMEAAEKADSLAKYQELADAARQQKVAKIGAFAWSKIGTIYAYRRDYTAAEKAFKKAAVLSERSLPRASELPRSILSSLADVQIHLDKLDAAQSNLLKLIDFYSRQRGLISDHEHEWHVFQLAIVKFKQNEDDKAVELLNENWKFASEQKNMRPEDARRLLEIIDCLQRFGRLETARQHMTDFTQCSRIQESRRLAGKRSQIYSEGELTAKRLGMPKEAEICAKLAGEADVIETAIDREREEKAQDRPGGELNFALSPEFRVESKK